MLFRAIMPHMLTITFYPESNRAEFIQATQEYQKLWDRDYQRIIEVTNRISGLSFIENHINAIVFEGISNAYPLMLRASYPEIEKRGTLVHELCHRLLIGNGIKADNLERSAGQLFGHQQLNLILFDIYDDLYREDFAKEMVRIESARRPFYDEAWRWALSLTKEERREHFKKLRTGGSINTNQ